MGETSSRNLLKQMCDGLEHIHSRGIIHRDLKPANIYLTREMVIKIGDFGLADWAGSGRRGICGTPNYISPEALLEQGYTPAADIWALGCIAYHMLAGRPPFDAPSQTTTYQMIRNHRFVPLSSSQAGAGVRHLVHWMLSFLPEERPSIPLIRSHPWMKRQTRRKESTRRLQERVRKRASAPIADKLDEMSTSSSSNESPLRDHCQSIKYERLCEKTCDGSLGNGNEETQPFWKSLLERVKLKKTNSLQFFPSTMLSIRDKIKIINRSAGKEGSLKHHIEQILKISATKNVQDSGRPVQGEEVPVLVSKWIDYSNKFGFGYQLTDGTTAVLFNDNSQIYLDGNSTRVTYITDEIAVYPIHEVPLSLTTRLTLLENFKEYMDTQLSCGMPRHCPAKKPKVMKQWYRGDENVVFQRKDLLQVNFLNDHMKIILYTDCHRNNRKAISVVTISNEKKMRKYDLLKFKELGCPDFLISHFNYIHSIL